MTLIIGSLIIVVSSVAALAASHQAKVSDWHAQARHERLMQEVRRHGD